MYRWTCGWSRQQALTGLAGGPGLCRGRPSPGSLGSLGLATLSRMRERVWGCERERNAAEDRRCVGEHLVVTEAKHANSAGAELLRSGLILCGLARIVVDGSVKLDAEPCRGTVEVEDESVERVLAAKFPRMAAPKEGPELPLGGGHRPSQGPRSLLDLPGLASHSLSAHIVALPKRGNSHENQAPGMISGETVPPPTGLGLHAPSPASGRGWRAPASRVRAHRPGTMPCRPSS
jgi:hypothetical protein